MGKQKKNDDRLDLRATLSAIGQVMGLSFRISPGAIVIKVIAVAFDAITPLLVAYLAAQTINNVTLAFDGVDGAYDKAVMFVILTSAVGFLTIFKTTITAYIDQVVRYKVESSVSDMMYDHFVRLDFWRYEDKDTMDMYDKSRDFTSFFVYVFDRIGRLFAAIFGMLAAIVALVHVSPLMSMLVFLAILPSMVIQFRLNDFSIRHWRGTVTDRRKQKFIEYNMMHPEAVSELRVYGLTDKMLRLRQKYRNKDMGAILQNERRFVKWRVMSNVLEASIQLGSLLWAVSQIANKRLPVGQFVYIQQVVSNALRASSDFVYEYGSIDEDLAKLSDYTDFMALPQLRSGGVRLGSVDTIELRDVSFIYPKSSKAVLSDVSMHIRAGEHVALVGENGAGKSTLIKILLGQYQPTSGEILINGVNLNDYDLASWHRKLGVLVQGFITFPFLTMGQNIYYGDVDVPASDRAKRMNHALRMAEAEDIVQSLPKGLDTILSTWIDKDEAIQLSGGQWQRVGLARNFFRQAPLMILDEPTSAIDALAEARIFDRLFDRSNNNTLLVVSHRLTTIENADNIYVLENGRVVQQGAHAQLVANKSGEYVRMFRRQLKDSAQGSK